jgi:hypothetical protein
MHTANLYFILEVTFFVIIYSGIGFIFCLIHREDFSFKKRFILIFGWIGFMIYYIIKGYPDEDES